MAIDSIKTKEKIMIHFAPGDRVVVFDPTLYKNDRDTPLNKVFKLATVVCYYGLKSERYGNYPSLIDVVFDHDNRLSKAHFTTGVKRIDHAKAHIT